MFDFKFDWCREVECDVKIIDEQHRELFRIGRDIEQLIVSGCHNVPQQQLLDIVCELREFINYHFYTEECLIEESGYTDAVRHLAAHNAFKNFILSIDMPALSQYPEKVLPGLKEALQDFLFGHILIHDKDLCQFLNMRDKQ